MNYITHFCKNPECNNGWIDKDYKDTTKQAQYLFCPYCISQGKKNPGWAKFEQEILDLKMGFSRPPETIVRQQKARQDLKQEASLSESREKQLSLFASKKVKPKRQVSEEVREQRRQRMKKMWQDKKAQQ